MTTSPAGTASKPLFEMSPGLQALSARLETVRNLPTLPVIIDKLGAAVMDPKSDARRIAGIIGDDQAMMARILKVVNSVFYAGVEPVTSIQLAVARIGMMAVRNLALSTAVFTSFGSFGSEKFDRTGFWKHSICTGIGANVLYKRCGKHLHARYGRDILHLAGLLHDIGKIVLEQYCHEPFMKALTASREESMALMQTEARELGADHAEVGGWLGERWRLASEVLQVIRWHHDPLAAAEPVRELVLLIHMSNYICNREQIGWGGDAMPAFHEGAWKALGLSVGDIPEVVDQVNEESKQSELLAALT